MDTYLDNSTKNMMSLHEAFVSYFSQEDDSDGIMIVFSMPKTKMAIISALVNYNLNQLDVILSYKGNKYLFMFTFNEEHIMGEIKYINHIDEGVNQHPDGFQSDHHYFIGYNIFTQDIDEDICEETVYETLKASEQFVLDDYWNRGDNNGGGRDKDPTPEYSPDDLLSV